MPTSKLLSQLTLAKKPTKPVFSPEQHRRNKLLTRMEEQREMARCMLAGENFTAYKEKWVDDEEGGKRKVKLPKRVKPWYYEVDGNWYVEVRYGNKPLELAKGKAAIQITSMDEIVATIDTLIEATREGELDTPLSKYKKAT